MKAAGRSATLSRTSQQHHTSERTEALAEILQERRRRIREELERLFRRLREEDRPATGDEGDRAVYGLDRELGSARVDQLTQVRRRIDDALARHAEGRYGRCLACETEIPVARLRALPFALYCRECQQAAEEKSRTALAGPIA
jgi:DnaK suppressor protein